MADISVTAASVLQVTGSSPLILPAGAGVTLTQGMAVYVDSATNTLKKAIITDANTANVVGITLGAASPGQYCPYQTSGDITIGGTMTQGQTYVVSPNAGGVAPVSDLSSGNFVKIIGVAKSTTVLSLILQGASTLTSHG